MYDTVKTFEMFRVDAVVIRHKENEYNKNYGLNVERVKKMKKESIIMHPEPFNRNVEITDDVVECKKSRIFKQVENGIFVRMALINMVLEE